MAEADMASQEDEEELIVQADTSKCKFHFLLYPR